MACPITQQYPVPYECVFIDTSYGKVSDICHRCYRGCRGWFCEIMNAIAVPAQTCPKTFTPEQLKNLTVPTLLSLGEKDNLIGNLKKARHLVQNIPDIRVNVLNTGHAMGKVGQFWVGIFTISQIFL